MFEAGTKSLSSSQIRELEQFGDKLNRFGVNLVVCGVAGEMLLLCDGGRFASSREQLIQLSKQALSQDDGVCKFDEGNLVFAAVLKSDGEANGVVLIDLGDMETGSEYLSEMLELFSEKFHAVAKASEQIDTISAELAQVYEELVLLYKLSTNMKVTRSDTNFLQMACDNLTDIVDVGGIAVFLAKIIEDERKLVLAAGSGLIDVDECRTSVLHNRLEDEIHSGKEALLDSEIDSPFKYEWADNIKNIIAVPLWGKGKGGSDFSGSENDNRIMGLMVAVNRVDKPDFDSTDMKLFNSVANECAVFIENERLFKDLKELFIGSLKALTNSIDAKDQYTRGHSERVAFISQWIALKLAEEENLDESQMHKIYLAGLLHDIGKMGIDGAVLRKKGKLNEQDIAIIRAHPSVGAGILSAIKQMHDIVPGVLSHHERMDGNGYPDGLTGEQIPLIGKIVGLADSFDAMTSERTYRKSMSVEEALEEIESKLGTQFDEKIGRVFINSDVYQLWDIICEGFSGANGDNSFAEYGTIAVGTLIG
ncbi:MAG: HD domain-containing protein [Planctomycetes bacterium]|nr:HD domain-containing protein [Planctomycetota bacterium]